MGTMTHLTALEEHLPMLFSQCLLHNHHHYYHHFITIITVIHFSIVYIIVFPKMSTDCESTKLRYGGDVHIDEDENWSVNSTRGVRFMLIILVADRMMTISNSRIKHC